MIGIGIFQDYYQGHQLSNYSPSDISWIASLELFVMFAGVRLLFTEPNKIFRLTIEGTDRWKTL